MSAVAFCASIYMTLAVTVERFVFDKFWGEIKTLTAKITSHAALKLEFKKFVTKFNLFCTVCEKICSVLIVQFPSWLHYITICIYIFGSKSILFCSFLQYKMVHKIFFWHTSPWENVKIIKIFNILYLQVHSSVSTSSISHNITGKLFCLHCLSVSFNNAEGRTLSFASLL